MCACVSGSVRVHDPPGLKEKTPQISTEGKTADSIKGIALRIESLQTCPPQFHLKNDD